MAGLFSIVLWAGVLLGDAGFGDSLMDGSDKAQGDVFTALNGIFTIQIAQGWLPYFNPKIPDLYEFRGAKYGGNTVFWIQRLDVNPAAIPRHFLSVSLDQRIGKKPLFKVIDRRDVMIAGYPAAIISGSYAFQGNLQYLISIEEAVVMVGGGKAFLLHVECPAEIAAHVSKDMELFYTTFKPVGALTPKTIAVPGASDEGGEDKRFSTKGRPDPFVFE